MQRDPLNELIDLMVEARVREADVTGDKRVPFGSKKHIQDLEKRIEELTLWKNRAKKGSDTRANYARVIQKLKAELASARNAAAKQKK